MLFYVLVVTCVISEWGRKKAQGGLLPPTVRFVTWLISNTESSVATVSIITANNGWKKKVLYKYYNYYDSWNVRGEVLSQPTTLRVLQIVSYVESYKMNILTSINIVFRDC